MENPCKAISEKMKPSNYIACCPFICNGGKKCLHIPIHEWSKSLITKILENFSIKSDAIKLHSDVTKLEKCKKSRAYTEKRTNCDGDEQPFYGCLKTQKMFRIGPSVDKYVVCECHHNQLLEIIKRSIRNGSILGVSKVLLMLAKTEFDPEGSLSNYN